MKTRMALLYIALFTSIVLFPTAAFSWGSAVHAYIGDQLAARGGLLNENEVYGSMAPDLFNFRFDKPEYREFLYAQTHENFQKVVDEAKSQPAMALALGFLSHNDVWGADSTAHHSGITFGLGKGYVIAKAEILLSYLNSIQEYVDLEIPVPVGMEIAHQLVEDAVDILMKRVDSKIGEKMIAAALSPHPNMPLLVVNAYAGDLASYAGISEREAAKFIVSSDRQFRNVSILYGQALTLDEDAAAQALAEQLADLAQAFFAAYGITWPPEVDPIPLLQLGIGQAMLLCENDFEDEVAATIDHIELSPEYIELSPEYRARFK